MTPLEKTILLIAFIPLTIAAVAGIIHTINTARHRRRAKRTHDRINEIR